MYPIKRGAKMITRLDDCNVVTRKAASMVARRNATTMIVAAGRALVHMRKNRGLRDHERGKDCQHHNGHDLQTEANHHQVINNEDSIARSGAGIRDDGSVIL